MIALVPNPVPIAPTCIAVRVFEPETNLEHMLAKAARQLGLDHGVQSPPVWRLVLCQDGRAWLSCTFSDKPPAVDRALDLFRSFPAQWVEVTRATTAPDPAP